MVSADRGCTRMLSYFVEYELESCWIVDLGEAGLGEWGCCWQPAEAFEVGSGPGGSINLTSFTDSQVSFLT